MLIHALDYHTHNSFTATPVDNVRVSSDRVQELQASRGALSYPSWEQDSFPDVGIVCY